MINLKPASQKDQETSTVVAHGFRRKHLFLFVLASVLVHSLGLLIFGIYYRTQPHTKEKIESKPIKFVVVPPEESREKPSPETQKRSTENSVAEKIIKPEKTSTEETGEEISPTPNNATPPPPTPQETTAAPKITTTPPPSPEKPVLPPESTPAPPPESTKPLVENQTPILSGSDTASIPQAKPKPKPEPTEKDAPVATRLPSQDKKSETIPESDPPQPTNALSKPTESSDSGAASLLEGDYQRTLANGGGDAFFSPEALNYESVLDPSQLNALKDIDLSEYLAEMKMQVKPNWNPSFAVEEYTTVLAYDIQKNGQITGLRVAKSSGSEKVDRESLEAIQNSVPFAPLPPEFPLEAMKVTFTFNIYIY